MKDERISSLLDSNNELSLENTQKNQTIRSLENEIVLLKNDTASDKVQENLLKSLVKKINDRKNSYETAFKGKEYLTISCKDDMDYIESINVPLETEITTIKALEKHSEISAKLKSMLSKFHKERDNYLKGNSQSSTITYPSNEPQPSFETTGRTQASTDSIAESKTVETTATYESFDDEPSSQCNDLSPRTFAEIKVDQLISEMNQKKFQIKRHIDVFKEKYPSTIARFQEDIDYVESNDISISLDIPVVEAYEQMLMMSVKLNSIEQKFANLIQGYAQRIITLDQLQKMYTKISNQKGSIFGSLSKFRNDFKADFDYAESFQFPKLTSEMSPEAIERSYENAKLINTRLKLILSKLHGMTSKKTKRNSLNSESSSERTNDSGPSMNDLSTETDFTPRITLTTFRKYDFIRGNCTDPKSHLSELEELFESTKQNNEIILNNQQKKIDSLFEDFIIKALKEKDKIKFEVDQFSDFYWLIKGYRKSSFFPTRTEIVTAVKSQFSDSSDGLII